MKPDEPERERELLPVPFVVFLKVKALRKRGRRVGTQAATMTTFCSTLGGVRVEIFSRGAWWYLHSPEHQWHDDVDYRVLAGNELRRECWVYSRGSVLFVNVWIRVALTIVMMAESKVSDIITHTPTLVEVRIWSFQKADTGTIANTISVNVVQLLTKYWNPSKTFGSQHVPGIRWSHRMGGGSHWR